jgi:hypothetical protein
LFGKEKKPLRWLVFPTENLFFGKTQKSFLLGLLFFDVPFFVFNESCGKNYHTPNNYIYELQFAFSPNSTKYAQKGTISE